MYKTAILYSLVTLILVRGAVIQNQTPSISSNYYEALYRNYVIETNRQKIQSFNQQSLTFTLEPNKFLQYSQAQFQSLYLVTRVSNNTQVISPFQIQSTQNTNINTNTYNTIALYSTVNTDQILDIDWNRAGMVTSVKNQGGCGSCWAFSAVSDLESSYKLNGYQCNLDLSQQQLVDCSGSFYNAGCGGGWMTNAFAYIYKNPLSTQTAYPYTATANTCKNITGTFSLKNIRTYWQNQNCQLLVDILKTRPLSVAVAADSFAWGFYKSGVLTQCAASINHGVVLTGVKRSGTQNYWIVKNSWGSDWGQNGYLKMDRSQNSGNLCEICSYPQHSIV